MQLQKAQRAVEVQQDMLIQTQQKLAEAQERANNLTSHMSELRELAAQAKAWAEHARLGHIPS
eukprot:1994523-Lingulodinium_polyedra.AAC.1